MYTLIQKAKPREEINEFNLSGQSIHCTINVTEELVFLIYLIIYIIK